MIKEKFNSLLNVLKRSVEKFPMTIISVWILTLIITIFVGNMDAPWEVIGRITLGIVIFASSTYLIESLIKEKNQKTIIYYLLSIFVATVLTLLSNIKTGVLGMSNELFIHYVIRFIVCYILSILILSIYVNYKKSNIAFEKYLTNVVVNIFKTNFIYGILAVGSSIIVAIFIFLILNGRGYMLIARVEILLLGIYYVPTLIYSFCKQNNETGKFAKIVIKYVLGSLVMLAFSIIYIYLLKILILRNIPSNEIFRILAALFLVGLPIWTMCDSLDEGNTFDKIIKKLPLLFVPFIFLQIYSIAVRIGEYGLTEARYMGIMLIIFEIIYTIIYIKNKTKIAVNLLLIIALIVMSTITPFINMFRISAFNQFIIFNKYNQKDYITQEEKSKMNGAYRYLKYSPVGKQYLENYKFINKVDEYESNEKYENSKTINVDKDEKFINIDGYKKLYEIYASSYSYGNDNKTIDETFGNMTFNVTGTDNIIKVKLTDRIKQYIKLGNSLARQFDNINEIIIDNNRKIILDSVNIYYNETTNEIYSYSITGYLLEK